MGVDISVKNIVLISFKKQNVLKNVKTMLKKMSKTTMSKRMSKYYREKCKKSKCQERVKNDIIFGSVTKEDVVYDTFLILWFLTFFLTLFRDFF
jgi:hypothetical protein